MRSAALMLGALLLAALLPAGALAQNMGLLGVQSRMDGTAANAVPSTSLLRDAWKWQEDGSAVLYATVDVAAVRDVLSPDMAAGLVASLLKIDQPEEVAAVSRLSARCVFTTLTAPDTFVLADTTLPPATLAQNIAARAGATPDSFDDGGRTYYTVPLGSAHELTLNALSPTRVQLAFHATDGEVSLLAGETPMAGAQASALDPGALISVRMTNPRLLPDVSGGGLLKDSVRNGLKNSLVGSVASLDARVTRQTDGNLHLAASLVPVAGVTPADLARRYATVRSSAGLAGAGARALIDRLVITPGPAAVSVEATASPAEFQPLLQRLAQGQMPWS